MQKSISLLLGWYYKVLGITHYKVTHHCNHITFVRDIVMLPIIVHPVTLLLHGKRYRRIRCLISRLQNSVFTQAETPELNAPPYGIVFMVYSCCSIKRQQLAVWCTNLFCKMTIKLSKTSEIFREEEDTTSCFPLPWEGTQQTPASSSSEWLYSFLWQWCSCLQLWHESY